MTDTDKLAEPSPKAGGELADAAREELRAAFMDVQRIKRSGPIEDEGVLPPIWRAINAIPAALYHLDKMAEFESDLAAEDDATRTPEQPDRNAVLDDPPYADRAERFSGKSAKEWGRTPPATGEGETIASIIQWGDETFGPCTAERAIFRAGQEWTEMIEPDADVPIEAADVIICLLRIPGIADAIQRKMGINRGRTWRLMGDGTGYHVPAENRNAD